MRTLLTQLLLAVTIAGCAGHKRAESAAVVALPAWTLEDCVEREGSFYVTGAGRGPNQSDAGRSASLAARRSGVLCVFGASFTAELSTNDSFAEREESGRRRTSAASATSESSRQAVSVETIDWQGFELVPGHMLTLEGADGFRVHAQYRWRRDAAMQSKAQAQRLADAAERTRVLKAQSEAQARIIRDQEAQLAQLDRQERELRQVKDRADAAATRIADLSRAQKDHNTSISRVIANLYCGVTFADVVRELGQPEETFFDTGGACTFDVNKMRWAEFVLEGEYGGPCHGSVEEAERAILSKRVSTVQGKFGHGDTRYLCH